MAENLRTLDVIPHLADGGLDFFATEDLVREFGLTPEKAGQLAFRLTRAHVIDRLAPGRFALRDPADWGRADIPAHDWYLVAAHIVHPTPYFLAFYTAMEIHNMIQHPLRTVYVAIPRARKDITLGPVRFRFPAVAPARFFGIEAREVEPGRAIKVTDLDRTLIDCVDRPEFCGGIEEIYRGMVRRKDDVNRDRLLRYGYEWNHPTAVKRLGFLLEAAGVGDPELLWGLEKAAGRLKRYVPLDKTGPRTGEKNKRWELLVNIDVEQLLRGRVT